jgi:hypothetical protein
MNQPFTRPLRYGCVQINANASVRSGSSCLWQQQQHRHLSAFATTAPRSSSSSQTRRPTPKRKRKQQKQQQEQQQIPKWTATASVLIVPFMFAAWGVSDWIFGNRTKGHNEDLRQEFLEEQRRRQQNVQRNNNNTDNNDNTDMDDSWLTSLDTQPTLFHCVIRKNAGLKHCLSGVQLGDVVEVLEEGVGPDKAYNLCRLAAKQQQPAHNNEGNGESPSATMPSLSRDVCGWFPIRWLQKLDHYESIVREQQHSILSSEDQE